MRSSVALVVSLILIGAAQLLPAGEPAITIDRISPDDVIQGRVSGLEGSLRAYKIVVYVHTDRWYIHPYAGQGEGDSWAAVKKGGTWEITTVKRRFSADKIAVLVVNAGAKVPSTTSNVRSIPHRSLIIKNLKGTPDYGKL